MVQLVVVVIGQIVVQLVTVSTLPNIGAASYTFYCTFYCQIVVQLVVLSVGQPVVGAYS